MGSAMKQVFRSTAFAHVFAPHNRASFCYGGLADPGKSQQGGRYVGEVLLCTQDPGTFTRGSERTPCRRLRIQPRSGWILARERGQIPARGSPPRPIPAAQRRHLSTCQLNCTGGIPPSPATLSLSHVERRKSQPPCVFRCEALSRLSGSGGYLQERPRPEAPKP